MIALAACGAPPADVDGGSGTRTPAVSPFCRRLEALEARVREVRSWMAPTVERYGIAVARLDGAFRRMRELAPPEVDLAPIEYANGRFGEIVRAMDPDLDPASARAAVAINLEAYSAAVYEALVRACGPESVDD